MDMRIKTIGIIGFGRFGQLLAKLLKHDGQVLVTSRHSKVKEAKRLGVIYETLEKVAKSDWVILAVPISQTEKVIKKIAKLVKPHSLVMDTCSVKVWPCRWLKKHLPKNTEILGSHPLFGPDSAKAGLKGKQIVLCPLRIKHKTLQRVKILGQKWGLEVLTTTPQEHDKQTALSLALVHFIGRGLAASKIRAPKLQTLGWQRLWQLSQNANNDTWRLFFDLQKYNPYAKRVREQILQGLKKLNKKLKNKK